MSVIVVRFVNLTVAASDSIRISPELIMEIDPPRRLPTCRSLGSRLNQSLDLKAPATALPPRILARPAAFPSGIPKSIVARGPRGRPPRAPRPRPRGAAAPRPPPVAVEATLKCALCSVKVVVGGLLQGGL